MPFSYLHRVARLGRVRSPSSAMAMALLLLAGGPAAARDTIVGHSTGSSASSPGSAANSSATSQTATAATAATAQAAQAAILTQRAQDSLVKATATFQAGLAAQAAARAAALSGPNHLVGTTDVPDGLGVGGLNPVGGATASTTGSTIQLIQLSSGAKNQLALGSSGSVTLPNGTPGKDQITVTGAGSVTTQGGSVTTSAGIVTTTNGGTLAATNGGSISLTAGSGTLTTTTATTLTSTLAGTVTLPGTLGTETLTANQALAIPAGSSVSFTGTTAGTVNVAGAGTVTLKGAGTLTLTNATAATTGGTITTSSGTTTFTSGGAVSSLSAGSQINVVGSGTVALAGTSDGSTAVSLPVIVPATSNFTTTGTLYSTQAYNVPASWSNIGALSQSTGVAGPTVTITQNSQQALLDWTTFNIGKNTTLDFDQSGGGANVGTWVAINRILDPSLAPSQILGNLQASGQVYVINQNGIIFGGSSQVNTHALVASTLPINSNLIQSGLLNNPQAQFLFSSTAVTAPSANTSTLGAVLYDPSTDLEVETTTANGQTTVVPSGDITVQQGAVITSPTTPEHVGGKIALLAPNVDNEGTLSSPDGQIILAAGQQVGLLAHTSGDPSLRGLDVAVGTGDGTASNGINGYIDAPRADVTITGSTVDQLGIINSTTSVSLNGRIDLLAVNNAIPVELSSTNTAIFSGGTGGAVNLGANSLTAILPEYSSTDTVVGDSLALPSEVYLEGEILHMGTNAQLLAPNASATLSFGALDSPVTPPVGLSTATATPENYSSTIKTINLSTPGQVYFDSGATLDVSGSSDVAASVSENIVSAQLRGAELENSPLQKDGPLRGQTVQIDVTQTGTNADGSTWVGSPIGNLSGYAGLVQHTVGELTTAGGSVSINTNGGSVVLQPTSTINVSGGSTDYQGAMVQTTKVVTTGGQIIDISQATPNLIYQGIYTGFSTTSAKWGVTQTSINPVEDGAYYEAGYVQGAGGGSLTIATGAAALDGSLYGNTTAGTRQQAALPSASSLNLTITGNALPSSSPGSSPAVDILFQQAASGQLPVDPFSNPDQAVTLSADRQNNIFLSPDLVAQDGFGQLAVSTPNGKITVQPDAVLEAPAGGSLSLTAANLDLYGQIYAPGGTLSITSVAIDPILTLAGGNPYYDPTRANINLFAGAVLSTAGLTFDETSGQVTPGTLPYTVSGGSITVSGAVTTLAAGSTVDVSGGAVRKATGKIVTGQGGSIMLTGYYSGGDDLPDGQLTLAGTLSGYGVGQGGKLNLTAPAVQVGASAIQSFSDNAVPLILSSGFFSQGGFSSFALTGLAGVQISDNISPIQSQNQVSVVGNQLVLSQVSSSLLPQYPAAPVNLSFAAPGSAPNFTGTLTLASTITASPTSAIGLSGEMVNILGEVIAPGGTVTISGGSTSSILGTPPVGQPYEPVVTVYLGPNAVVDTSGTTITTSTPLDGQNFTTGTVLAGGTISISGNVIGAGAVGTPGTVGYAPGASLKANGTVGALDVPVSSTVISTQTDPNYRLNPYAPKTVASNGGSINLKGSELLYFDGTVSAMAGNATALGGTLTIGSGVASYSTAEYPNAGYVEIELQQSGAFLTGQTITLGTPLPDAVNPDLGGGHFTAQQVQEGGFASLNLNGNVQFVGNVSLALPGNLKITPDGLNGTIFGDGSANQLINLSAYDVSIGGSIVVNGTTISNFAPNYLLLDAAGNPLPYVQPGLATPTYGPASFNVTAYDLINVGYLSLQNIGTTSFDVTNGDIRGGGSLYGAGTINLTAGQIYTPTDTTFTIAAFAGGAPANTPSGIVNIYWDGVTRSLPLSAGGTINVYGSTINQDGVLVAPFGTINLGALVNPVTGLTPTLPGVIFALDSTNKYAPLPDDTQTAPVTQTLVLGAQSVTSVSGVDPTTNEAFDLPYGTNLNGTEWIDPAGNNITTGGLPVKTINLQGVSVNDQKGSLIDLTGGGDLFAYNFNSGLGGTNDILNIDQYANGSILTKSGKPVASTSFAVIPGYQADYAPVDLSVDSTGALPYANSTITSQVGQQVYLAGGDGLAAGTYTILPARYALLPGAFLVTPASGAAPAQTTVNPDGSVNVAGYVSTTLNTQAVSVVTGFTIDSTAVVNSRAEYDISSANTFLKSSAVANNLAVPRLPVDAGQLVFNATGILQIQGGLSGQAATGGLGSTVDIGSPDDIYIVPNSTSTPTLVVPTGTDPTSYTYLTLDANELNGFGADSLLIGGIRSTSTTGTAIDPSTNAIYVQNDASSALTGNEIILVSKQTLTLADGATITQSGVASTGAQDLTIGNAATPGSGDGTLLRVSGDPQASFNRLGVDATDTVPNLAIGAGASISGVAVTLDSTSGTSIDPTAKLDQGAGGNALFLQSGEIALQIDPKVSLATASGLIISNTTLQSLESSVQELSLLSYSSIDLYGAGVLGGLDSTGQPVVKNLALNAAGILGYNNDGGSVTINAQKVSINNSGNQVFAASASIPTLPSGVATNALLVNADTIQLGANTFTVDGYSSIGLTAANGLMVSGTGGFTSQGGLNLAAPLITGATGAKYAFNAAGGSLVVTAPASPGTATVTGGLGAALSLTGSSVTISSTITVPSGTITALATSGDVEVQKGGALNAGGEAVIFGNVTSYTDGGQVNLTSSNGQVTLDAGSAVNVAAAAGGGNAGSVVVSAVNGIFTAAAQTLQGTAGVGGTGGKFSATVSQAGTLSALTTPLTAGNFQSLTFDVLTGSVTVDGAVSPALTSSQAGLNTFSLTAEQGGITVDNAINASGIYGGTIDLFANQGVVLTGNASLSVAGQKFDSAGNGGLIDIETRGAGATGSNVINIETNSTLDLSIAGGTGGTLHLRAPQTATQTNLLIDKINGKIVHAGSIIAEGYEVYDSTTGIIENTDPTGNIEGAIAANVATFGGNTGAVGVSGSITDDLVGGTVNAGYASTTTFSTSAVLHVQPGAEIVNTNTATPFQLDANGSTLTVNSSSSITLPNGTPGDDMITSDGGGTITVGGATTTFAAGTPISVAAGGTLTLPAGSTLSFDSGSGGAVPLALGAGTFTPGQAATQTITGGGGGSTVTLNSIDSTGTRTITKANTNVAVPSDATMLYTIVLSKTTGTVTATDSNGVVTTLPVGVGTVVSAGTTINFPNRGGSYTLTTSSPIVTAAGSAISLPQGTVSSNTLISTSGGTITSMGYSLASGNSLVLNAGSSLTLPSGTPGNDLVTSTSAITFTGTAKTANAAGTLTAVTGGTIQAGTPFSLSAGGTITLSGDGTFTVASGTVSTVPLSVVSLASGSSLAVAAGSAISLPNGTPGNDLVTFSSAGNLTVNGAVTPFQANTPVAIPAGGTFTLASSGTVTFASGTAGNVPLLLTGVVTTSVLAPNTATTILAGSSVTFAGAGQFSLTATAGSFAAQPITLTSATNFTLAGDFSLATTPGNLTVNNTWNLASVRTATGEPGILTLRAVGNLVFNASLTDGFGYNANDVENVAVSPYTWDVNAGPSWSYRLIAGAAFNAAGASTANYGAVQSLAALGLSNASSSTPILAGSLLLGQNIPAGINYGVLTSTIAGTYAQLIRTGTGDITIDTGGSVDLLNQIASIYTAGSLAPTLAGFDVPNVTVQKAQTTYETSAYGQPIDPALPYTPQYTQAGGNISINAQQDIVHLTHDADGNLVSDTSWQFPTNWLYRRGATSTTNVFDATVLSASETATTTWWVNFSNFFEGVGALGGGNVTLSAGGNITNVDAVLPTNARMPYADASGNAVADVASNLVELGGGNLTVMASGAITGGSYYVEKGTGLIEAANITSDDDAVRVSAYDISQGYTTPLPLTLFLGDSSFTVKAENDLTIGSTVSPFWLPQAIGNGFNDQSIFSTFGTDTAVNLSSLLGTVTVQGAFTAVSSVPGTGNFLPGSLYFAYLSNASPFVGKASKTSPYATVLSNTATPWTLTFDSFNSGSTDNVGDYSMFYLMSPPIFRAAAYSGDVQYESGQYLTPSSAGTLQLLAASSIDGAYNSAVYGNGQIAAITLSDADPTSLPSVTNPFGLGQSNQTGGASNPTILGLITQVFSVISEAPSFAGDSLPTLQSYHTSGLLHDNDTTVQIATINGNIGDFTLISPERTDIASGLDLQDVSLYLQNNNADDISVVTANRDIILYDPNSAALVNLGVTSDPQSAFGDIEMSGPGTLEVLAGRNLTLGVGASNGDGTGVGITSIGNARNPYLPFDGANIIAGAGIGSATSLGASALNFTTFTDSFLNPNPTVATDDPSGTEAARYLPDLGTLLGLTGVTNDQIWNIYSGTPDASLTAAQQTVQARLTPESRDALALTVFYDVLRDAGRDHNSASSPNAGTYTEGYAAIAALFPTSNTYQGDISLTAREIKTSSVGDISLLAPGGGIDVGLNNFGTQAIDQGILTVDGGNISIFTDKNVAVGTSRIFTLHGGNEIIWSSKGNIAAGASSKTVQSAPPTRVLVDSQSGNVQTDLTGLATGGGIGVLETVVGAPPGDVDLIAPSGIVDAGDAGIRSSGNVNIAAALVQNAGNIQAGGSSSGVSTASAPNISATVSASAASGASQSTANEAARQQQPQNQAPPEDLPSIISVQVIGYGGGDDDSASTDSASSDTVVASTGGQ